MCVGGGVSSDNNVLATRTRASITVQKGISGSDGWGGGGGGGGYSGGEISSEILQTDIIGVRE